MSWVWFYFRHTPFVRVLCLFRMCSFHVGLKNSKDLNKSTVLWVTEVICDQLWMPEWILPLRSCQTFLLSHTLWLMWCKWGIWNTPAIQLYLPLSPLLVLLRTSLLGEVHGFFLPQHFRVWDTEGATVSNYMLLILSHQNHKHASEILQPDKTLFDSKDFPHILWGVSFWAVITLKVTFVHRLREQSFHTKQDVIEIFLLCSRLFHLKLL